MGRRGPPPKPTDLKVVQGTYRADRAARNEPRPAAMVPTCPDWLDHAAAVEWKRVSLQLAAVGMLSELDRTALALYCQALSEYLSAKALIEAEGETVTTDKGNVLPHPAVPMRNDAWRRCVQAAKEFGLTPSSRTRTSAGDGGQEPAPEKNRFQLLG